MMALRTSRYSDGKIHPRLSLMRWRSSLRIIGFIAAFLQMLPGNVAPKLRADDRSAPPECRPAPTGARIPALAPHRRKFPPQFVMARCAKLSLRQRRSPIVPPVRQLAARSPHTIADG